MRDISIATGSANPAMTWGVNNVVTDCGQHTVIQSNSSTAGIVDLNYCGDQANWAWCQKCQGLALRQYPSREHAPPAIAMTTP